MICVASPSVSAERDVDGESDVGVSLTEERGEEELEVELDRVKINREGLFARLEKVDEGRSLFTLDFQFADCTFEKVSEARSAVRSVRLAFSMLSVSFLTASIPKRPTVSIHSNLCSAERCPTVAEPG